MSSIRRKITKTILVAEDQPDNRQLLTDILSIFESQGVRVIVTENGKDAYDAAVREKPDLLLLDVMMPILSGIEVCQKIKNDPSLESIYIIMLTARIQKEDRIDAAVAGADEYITKPYDISIILERVQSVLGLSS